MNRPATRRTNRMGSSRPRLCMRTRETPKNSRRGMSLLEVLIAMFVLTVGLLGVAALIPLGGIALKQSEQVDRAGACGHAALAEVQVRGMLDFNRWNDTTAATAGHAFVIDPYGVARGMPATLGATSAVQRITLKANPPAAAPMDLGQAEQVFVAHDDLTFVRPEDMNPPPATLSNRPVANVDATNEPLYEGRYSWFLTVSPAAGEAAMPLDQRTVYTVSVAVCFTRSFADGKDTSGNPTGRPGGEHVAGVDFLGGSGWGGGSVLLSPVADEDPPLKLRTDQWIMLTGMVNTKRVCKWYRVVSADGGAPTTRVSLVGPDWDPTIPTTAIAIDEIVGVYTTTIDVSQ